MADQNFADLLTKASELSASDIHFMAGTPIRLRLAGELAPIGDRLSPDQTLQIARHILVRAGRRPPEGNEEFCRSLLEEDCAYSVEGVGRYRVNISKQRGSAMIVMRVISNQIPRVSELKLPSIVAEIALEQRGLVLLTGATGSGKSTTLASMIAEINHNRACKIVTIEDPIEFIYKDVKASIAQREVGSDTGSFADAMRAALRQDPDVILVGEMRDRETVDIALKAAETGHLVMSTVHTPDAPKTVNRLISFGDPSEQTMLRLRLADSLIAVISQRLLPMASGSGRIPAIEIMRTTASIRDCISRPEKTGGIVDLLKEGKDQYGMQSFDQHLMELYERGLITVDVAKAAATNPGDFERALTFT